MEFIKKEEIISLANPGVVSRQLMNPDNSTSQRVTITEVHLEVGASQPRHQHETSEQIWYATQGTGTLLLAEDQEMHFHAGDVVRFAEGDVHGLRNDGETEFIYVSVTAPPIHFGYAYQSEELTGGREGKIRKDNDKVIRPSNPWTPHVHAFLRYLKEQGMENIPTPYGLTENGEEIVSFVEGIVYNEELPASILTDEILVEVAQLLRRYHDLGAAYMAKLSGDEVWMLPARTPADPPAFRECRGCERGRCIGQYAPR